jgi:hypothetical protein
MTKKWEKFTAGKKLYFSNEQLQLSYPQASIKDVRLQQKPSPLKKEHPIEHLKTEISELFSYFVGLFCPPGSGSGSRPKSMRIRTEILV